FFQAEDGIRDCHVTGVQTCALPIFPYIQRPAEIMVHAFGENTFQIRIFYFLPALLPASYTLHGVKRDINFAVYKLLDSYTEPKATQTTVIKAKTNPSKEQ